MARVELQKLGLSGRVVAVVKRERRWWSGAVAVRESSIEVFFAVQGLRRPEFMLHDVNWGREKRRRATANKIEVMKADAVLLKDNCRCIGGVI